MNQCADYQLEISALLDGESDPGTALDLLEHVGSCARCGVFVRDVRAAQAKIDVAFPILTVEESDRFRPTAPRFPRTPRWAWGLAATMVLVMGSVLSVNRAAPTDTVDRPTDEELVVRLGENSGSMSDDRFVELATELLGADRVYRDQMFSVLDAVRRAEPRGETGTLDESIGPNDPLSEGALSSTRTALD